MTDITLERLHLALRASWSSETSSSNLWSKKCPSIGQCAVTALIVQDYFGGGLKKAIVDETSHYWNQLPDGREIDLTRDQFDSFDPLYTRDGDRDYVLSYLSTRTRYQKLKERVTEYVDLP